MRRQARWQRGHRQGLNSRPPASRPGHLHLHPIYTPGITAGNPVSVLSSLQAPPRSVREDRQARFAAAQSGAWVDPSGSHHLAKVGTWFLVRLQTVMRVSQQIQTAVSVGATFLGTLLGSLVVQRGRMCHGRRNGRRTSTAARRARDAEQCRNREDGGPLPQVAWGPHLIPLRPALRMGARPPAATPLADAGFPDHPACLQPRDRTCRG